MSGWPFGEGAGQVGRVGREFLSRLNILDLSNSLADLRKGESEEQGGEGDGG